MIHPLSDIIAHVNINLVEHQTDGYCVTTNVYEGPLDLLLQLIERAELDITRLALAQVTDQYLAHLKLLEIRDPEEVSAFLVIAARLIQIKSAALLPKPDESMPLGEEEEDLGEALARQLILYKRFKEIAGQLKQREADNLRTYLRLSPLEIKIEPTLDMSGITLDDLLQAAGTALANNPALTSLSKVVTMTRVTIREKIFRILEAIKSRDTSSFQEMLGAQTRVEVVVTFLALLELIKRHIIEANQPELFGDIQFHSIGELQEEELAEIEFDE